MSSMTRQQNKKKRQWIAMFNVSEQLQKMCSLKTTLFSNRKPLYATTHSFT
jgi:hypothetical protein